jgi:hypothetical protein
MRYRPRTPGCERRQTQPPAEVEARIEAQAMKLFSRRESPATVSGSLKIFLREAFRLQAMHREQQKEAA